MRFTRITDPNADGGTPETRWDGFVRVGFDWSLVAECVGSLTKAKEDVARYVDDMIEEGKTG